MDIFAEIARLRKEGRKAALATIIQVQGSIPSYESSKILIRDDGSIVGTVGGGCVEAEVWSVAQEVMREEKPRRLHFNLNANPEYDNGLVCGGSLDIFVEPILATPTAVSLRRRARFACCFEDCRPWRDSMWWSQTTGRRLPTRSASRKPSKPTPDPGKRLSRSSRSMSCRTWCWSRAGTRATWIACAGRSPRRRATSA